MKLEKYSFVVLSLLLPMGFFLVFVMSPYLQAMYYSFTDWQGFSAEMNFIGLDNYTRLLHDERFWQASLNNVFLGVLSPLITIGLALFFAAMLNFGASSRRLGRIEGARGTQIYRVIYFFPQVLSIAITAVLWQSVFNPVNGILTSVVRFLGLPERVWLNDPSIALWCVLVVGVWGGVGFYMIILSAAMAGVPREHYEAALIDGASKWSQFWHITVPSIRETILLCLIYSVIGSLDSFALVQIMTVGPGGPDGATTVMGYLLYEEAFMKSNYGYASAIGVFLALLSIVIALGARFLAREKN
ncbi:MAG TPA: sugar ABC transporter permease [Candidatus Avipropionibacterium avicola]|uniref:Sugar ABC transporter permease n=1 Tax=Candidatus Avipropionibacterium avicola TaxID=2840701 RepID=A0A9D1GWL2_9ACTN|nr:sugar ABC transporter permease [Candidatus Avipropionibacterium avicola]